MAASTRRLILARRLALAGAGLSVMLAFGGCYEHVVGAKGAAADQYNVHEPYQESSAIDNWIWGESSSKGEYKAKPGIRTQ